VSITLVLYGTPERGNQIHLNAGQKYAFPFSFQIPLDCPSSCYLSSDAHLSYMLHAEVDRPWAFDYNAYLQPNIVQPVGCSNPSDLVAREAHDDHEICCWLCGRGHIEYGVQIPYGAYSFAEKISIQADIRNESSQKTLNLSVNLRRVWSYTAESRSEYLSQTLDREVYTLTDGSSGMIVGQVTIPHNLDVASQVGKLISI
jgi:hypothetical protein